MTSNVEICNVGLTAIDRKRITDLLDGSTSGNDCNAIFEPVRQELIRGHDWNFARLRVKLAQTVATPISGFDFQYQLPTGWLRTVVVSDADDGHPGIRYRQEADKILSDAVQIYLTYIADITDPAKQPADFRALFSYELASRLAKTSTVREEMRKERDDKKRKAMSSDSVEDDADDVPLGTWVWERNR